VVREENGGERNMLSPVHFASGPQEKGGREEEREKNVNITQGSKNVRHLVRENGGKH